MTAPEVREPGYYAVVAGREVRVESHGRGFVRLPTAGGPAERRELDELDDLLSVRTTATWRGGTIAVSAVDGDTIGFWTNDGDLAARERLDGDFHNGWHGVAPLAELTHVAEKVSSIHPRRRTT